MLLPWPCFLSFPQCQPHGSQAGCGGGGGVHNTQLQLAKSVQRVKYNSEQRSEVKVRIKSGKGEEEKVRGPFRAPLLLPPKICIRTAFSAAS